MPNRKTFDEKDRYDHSSHSTQEKEAGDLQATPHEADVPVSKPGGFQNDPSDNPNDPDEAREKFRKKNQLVPP
jgi:hypothetical protein